MNLTDEQWAEKDMARFIAKVNVTGCCWYWTASKNATYGYGRFSTHDLKIHQAHRWLYERLVEPLPEGLVLDHICHVTACVNPDHLIPSTPQANAFNWSNRERYNKFGTPGVYWDERRNKFAAQIMHNRKFKFLGYFLTAEEANQKVRATRKELLAYERARAAEILVDFREQENPNPALIRVHKKNPGLTSTSRACMMGLPTKENDESNTDTAHGFRSDGCRCRTGVY